MNIAEVIITLTERKNYLTGRIALKMERGWENEWDRRERDALEAAIEVMEQFNRG